MSSSYSPSIQNIKDENDLRNAVAVSIGGRGDVVIAFGVAAETETEGAIDTFKTLLSSQVLASNLSKVIQDKSPSILKVRVSITFDQDGLADLFPYFFGFVGDHVRGSSLGTRGIRGYAPSLRGRTENLWVYSAEVTQGAGYTSLVSVLALSIFVENFARFSNGDVVAKSQARQEYIKWRLG